MYSAVYTLSRPGGYTALYTSLSLAAALIVSREVDWASLPVREPSKVIRILIYTITAPGQLKTSERLISSVQSVTWAIESESRDTSEVNKAAVTGSFVSWTLIRARRLSLGGLSVRPGRNFHLFNQIRPHQWRRAKVRELQISDLTGRQEDCLRDFGQWGRDRALEPWDHHGGVGDQLPQPREQRQRHGMAKGKHCLYYQLWWPGPVPVWAMSAILYWGGIISLSRLEFEHH